MSLAGVIQLRCDILDQGSGYWGRILWGGSGGPEAVSACRCITVMGAHCASLWEGCVVMISMAGTQ